MLNKYCVTISSVLLVASKGFGSQAMFVWLSTRAGFVNISPRTSQLQKQDLVFYPWKTYAVLRHPRKQKQLVSRRGWCLVAQPGLWVWVCFPTVAPLARHLRWLLHGELYFQVFGFVQAASLHRGRCSAWAVRELYPPGSCSLAMVAVFSLSWLELVKVMMTRSHEWWFRFAVCLLLLWTYQHAPHYCRIKIMSLTQLTGSTLFSGYWVLSTHGQ